MALVRWHCRFCLSTALSAVRMCENQGKRETGWRKLLASGPPPTTSFPRGKKVLTFFLGFDFFV